METKFQTEMDRTLYGGGSASDSGASETGASQPLPTLAAGLDSADPSLLETPSRADAPSGVDDSFGMGATEAEDPNPITMIDQGEEDLSFMDDAEGDWASGLV